jgi:hypothetical protein
VRVLEKNRGALAFWCDAIAAYTDGRFTEPAPSARPNDWRVFSFESPPADTTS